MKKLNIAIAIIYSLSTSPAFGQAERQYGECWVGIDGTINAYSDSLNFLQTNRLPRFLESYLMDWKLRKSLIQCMAHEDEIISHRKVIIDRVTNEEVLRWIVESKNASYDKIYDPAVLEREIGHGYHNDFPRLPYMEESFRALARNRLARIEKIKAKINKP